MAVRSATPNLSGGQSGLRKLHCPHCSLASQREATERIDHPARDQGTIFEICSASDTSLSRADLGRAAPP